jgi:formiminotetrahydrofolate cyclodeaminase/Zn-dependent peptidase ImmA (M78 family)
MDNHLLNLPANELLHKFGAGEHKPGSGSAAAFHGLLAARLICTVITLTLDPKRSDTYKDSSDDMETAEKDIRDRILPRLEYLFEEDSFQFDKAIKLRIKRDNEKITSEKKRLSEKAREALIPATEIPLEIAKLCEDLARYALLICKEGFKSARGDSGVALSTAVSAIGGCLSIIDLNLLSFQPSKWTKNIRHQADLLRETYTKFSINIEDNLNSLRDEVIRNAQFFERIEIFKDKNSAGSICSNEDIEHLVRRLHLTIWDYKNKIWKTNTPTKPLEILDPEKVIDLIGYSLSKTTTLGQYSEGGDIFEVAGYIDNKDKKISISEQFSKEIQLFTAAHELGHAIMHEQSALHRDMPIDGSNSIYGRDRTETQANKFATYFLMPKKQIVRTFISIFSTELFIIDESTAFALISGSIDDLKSECGNLRALSRKLASTESYNLKRFPSMAQQYSVSVEAMAIRLEELKLLIFEP